MRLVRTMLAAALASVSLAQISGAGGPPPIDVTNDHVTCSTVVATVKLKPAFVDGGTFPASITVKGYMDGCYDNDNLNVVIERSTFSAKLTRPSNDCTTLVGVAPTSGEIVYKWKTQSPITPSTSTVPVTSLIGGLFSPGAPLGSATYLATTIGATSVQGAFTGGDGGAGSYSYLVTSQDVITVLRLCGIGGGLDSVNLSLGTFTLG